MSTLAQRAIPCDVCEDEEPGEYYCIDCKQTLCPQCEKNHKRVAATKHHNIILRAQVGHLESTALTCGEHGDQASCHCVKCDIMVCIRCITGKHQGHKMVDLTERFEKEKKLLQDDVNRMKIILPKLRREGKEVKSKKEEYEKKTQQISKDMEDEHHARLGYLTRIHNDRMKNLTTIRDKNLAKFDIYSIEIQTKINTCEERISTSEDAIRNRNFTSMATLAKVKISLPEFESSTTLSLPEPPSFCPGNVHSVGEFFGKLHILSPPSGSRALGLSIPTMVSKFTCPLAGDPSIFITKEGDVWLNGLGSRELVNVDIKGQVLGRRAIQKRPIALAVMNCGDVIISPHKDDSPSVSRLLKDGREQYVYDTSPSYSWGVSITADQKILICTGDGRVVRVNVDGSNVEPIFKGKGNDSAVHSIEGHDGKVIISLNASVMVSKDGKFLSAITHTSEGNRLGSPFGLAVDKMGNILCADFRNNCVFIIDQKHKMRELVGLSHGIKNPRWLAVDTLNNLWITQHDGTVHVVKYLIP